MPAWERRVAGVRLVLLGVLLGVAGAFTVALYVGTTRVPVAPVIAVAGNVAAAHYGSRLLGGRLGAALPGAGWLAAVVVLSSPGPGGDVVIESDWVGLSFLGAGALAAAVSAGLARTPAPRRSEPVA